MNIGISIIICCHNSENVISETLQFLAVQSLRGVSAEIILVDNNCTDGTVEVALHSWQSLGNHYPMKVVNEEMPGLNYARKRGISDCSFSYLIFCDDDNRLSPSYVIEVFNEFEKTTKVGILGGWSTGTFEIEKPGWFEFVETAYAVGGKIDEDVNNVYYVWGAGMALRTELAKNIFSEKFKTVDRSGTTLTSGGDLEICDLARKHGYEVKKLKSLKFQHYITKERLIWTYCLRLFEGFGFSNIQYSRDARSRFKIKASMIKAFALFALTNPGVVIRSLQKKEGDVRTLEYYSLVGALKASFI